MFRAQQTSPGLHITLFQCSPCSVIIRAKFGRKLLDFTLNRPIPPNTERHEHGTNSFPTPRPCPCAPSKLGTSCRIPAAPNGGRKSISRSSAASFRSEERRVG